MILKYKFLILIIGNFILIFYGICDKNSLIVFVNFLGKNMSTTNISVESFQTSRKFYDDIHYPRGISRSGDYSLKEVSLLENHGVAFLELSNGKREPCNDVEIQFLKVCQGDILPTTAEEKTWVKYKTKTLTPKQFHTLFGRNKVEVDPDTDTEPDDIDDD